MIQDLIERVGGMIYRYIAQRFGDEVARESAPLAAFIGGFAWDALTLSRIDQWLDLSILTVYLAGTLGMMKLAALPAKEPVGRVLGFLHKHSAFIFHFFIGGLFSAFVVFVFKSVTLSKSLVFFALIVAVFVLNEWAARRETPLVARMAMAHLAAFMYFVFVLPLLFGRIDYPVFLGAGLVSSLLILGTTRWILGPAVKDPAGLRTLNTVRIAAAGLFLLMNVFYGLRWIPPVPLVLKEASLALQVARHKDGTYSSEEKKSAWWVFWRGYATTYNLSETPKIYCFASVFAPTRISTTLVHDWQWKDPKKGWVSVDKIPYSISGGRDGGYRGYTYKSTLRPGEWHVAVKTTDGRIVGSIDFEVEE
jgi:hypothetical protein